MPAQHCYDYPRPAVTVDLAAFALDGDQLRVLLVRRGRDPCAGHWALPGGFLEIDEDPEAGARRELLEETGVECPGEVRPIGFYADPGRDPRGRTISLAFFATVRLAEARIRAGDDAAEAAWQPVVGDTPLAFDHARIVEAALTSVRRAVLIEGRGLALLAEEFGQADVEAMHRAVFGNQTNARGWIHRNERAGRIAPVEGSDRLYRAVNT